MRKKKKDQAYEEIRKLILESRSARELALSENTLAAELGMSHTCPRSPAAPSDGGLCGNSPKPRSCNSRSVRNGVNETFALRMAVEEFVLREMASRMSEGNVAEMDLYLARQREAIKKMTFSSTCNTTRIFT